MDSKSWASQIRIIFIQITTTGLWGERFDSACLINIWIQQEL